MTNTANDRRKEYAGVGTTGPFTGPRAFSASHIKVYLVDDDTQEATLSTSYTITGIGVRNRQTTIMMDDPVPVGTTLLILRTVPLEQLTDITNQGAYNPQVVEDALDNISQQVQQLGESVERSLRVDDTATGVEPLNGADDPGRYVITTPTGFGVSDTPPLGDLTLRQDMAAAVSGKGGFLVGFLASGVGAVARWVTEKLRDEVSVMDFGAVGDGVTDDTAAVQAALDAGHARVIFPQGKTFRWAGNGPIIPSNTRVIGHGAVVIQPNADTSATISEGTEYAAFRIACGSQHIVIEGFDIRGPYYGVSPTNAYRSIGIAVSGRYDQYFYDNPNYPAQPSSAPTGTSQNITIRFCQINGFGQSGIIADQIDQFYAFQNRIVNCNRDGIRMYGCRYFNVSDNYVRDMTPGFDEEGTAPNNNVYGITATRVYNSTAGDGTTTDYRPSQYGIIARNIVRDCPSWKALDTHGGTDLQFIDNIVHNAHIGIGIDKGGFNAADGYAPPRRIMVRGNTIIADPSNSAGNRCGIFAVANDATDNNIGEDLTIVGNYVKGYGRDTADGNIVVSYYRRGTIADNIIVGGLRSGLNFQNTVEDFTVRGGVIADIGKTSGGFCAGINPQGADQRLSIDGVAFRKTDTADTMTAVSITTPTAGYGVKLGIGNTYQGTITKVNSPGVLLHESAYINRTLAWGNINNTGTPAISVARNVTSVASGGTGIVTVTMTNAAQATNTYAVSVAIKGNGGSGAVRYAVTATSSTTFDIYTRDSSGTLTDAGFYFEVKGY